MNRILFLIAINLFSYQLQGQLSSDALRYSRLTFEGTARTMGVGGAIGALGTDFAVLSTNPAGLAAYRSGDFMFTPALKFTQVESELSGAGNGIEKKSAVKFLFDNVGYVVASQPIASSWKAVNFGIGMNKLVDYNRKFFYEGRSKGSIVNRFVEQANGKAPEEFYDFEEGLAWDTEAIFGPDADGFYGSDFQDAPDADVQRSESVKTKGAINELVISLAGNYRHKLMMGLTFGIPILRYNMERAYMEENITGEIPNFNDLTFTETLNTTGSGFNLKMGIIYRPVQMIRVGLAFHTPTKLRLQDTWQTTLNYDYTFEDVNYDNSAEALNGGPAEYRLRTPMRLIGSLALLFKKRGFLTAELEYLDYAANSFDLTVNSSDTGTEQYERVLNQEIERDFDSALSLKLGGELAFDIYRIRAGFGMFGTSYADKSSFDKSVSVGGGLRKNSYYLDLAYRYSKLQEDYVPYYLVDALQQPLIENQSNIHKVILTIGFRF